MEEPYFPVDSLFSSFLILSGSSKQTHSPSMDGAVNERFFPLVSVVDEAQSEAGEKKEKMRRDGNVI